MSFYRIRWIGFSLILLLAASRWVSAEPFVCPGGIRPPNQKSSQSGENDENFSFRWGERDDFGEFLPHTIVTYSFIETEQTGVDERPFIPNGSIVTVLPIKDGNGNFPLNARALIQKAFLAWSIVSDIRFVQVFEPDEEGQIRVGAHNSFVPPRIGHGFFPPFNGGSGQGLVGDLHLNSEKDWKRDVREFFATALHEIGHTIGLDHIIDAGAIDDILMYAVISSKAAPLTIHDQAYAQTIYGAPISRIIPNTTEGPRLINWFYPFNPFAPESFDFTTIDPNDSNNSRVPAYDMEFVRCPDPEVEVEPLCTVDRFNAEDDVAITNITTHELESFEIRSFRLLSAESSEEEKSASVNEIVVLQGNIEESNFVVEDKKATSFTLNTLPASTYEIQMRAIYEDQEPPTSLFSETIVRSFSESVTVDTLVTDDPTPELTGTISEPDSVIEVSINDQTFTATDNQDGTWILEDNTLNELPEGIYDVKVIAMDDSATFVDDTENELIIDMTTPSVIAGQMSGNNAYIEVQFSEGAFGDALGGSAISIEHFRIDVNNGDSVVISIDSITRPDDDDLQGGESKIRLNLKIEGTLSGTETIDLRLIKPIFDAASNSRPGGDDPIDTVMANGHIEFEFTFTPDDSTQSPITLTIGRDFEATNNNDDNFDATNADPEQAIFYLDNTQFSPGTQKLDKDFRPLEEFTIWQLRFVPQTPNQSGQLTWTLPNANPDYTLFLQKLDNQSPVGSPTDLLRSGLPQIELSEPTTFELVYGPSVDTELPELHPGWNLISVPFLSLQSIEETFGDMISDPVWFWNGKQFETARNDQPLNPERGYWIHSDTGGSSKPIPGLRTDGLVVLKTLWSLIGTIPEQIDIPGSIPIVWEWNPENQQFQKPVDSTLRNVKGYWMFSRERGAPVHLGE